MIRADHPSYAERGGVDNTEHWVSVLSTYQILVIALFVKYLFKTIKVIFVLYIDLQVKMLLSFKIFCQILKQF